MTSIRVKDVEYDFLVNGAKYSFEDLMRPCKGTVPSNVKKILIAEPYIISDYQMHSLAQCLIAIFQLTHGERIPNCKYILHTKKRCIYEMDNCEPYNPYRRGEKPKNDINVYKNIIKKSWDFYQKTSETKAVGKCPDFSFKTGKDMHDRSVTILCEDMILRYDLGIGLDILLDCTCLKRQISNNHFEGRTPFNKEPIPHNEENCGIKVNDMLSQGFNRPTRRCQVKKTTIKPCDKNLETIFEKFEAFSDPPLFNKKDFNNCNGYKPQIVEKLVSNN